jgi:hypothetical protein
VTNLKGKYTATLGLEMAAAFERSCNDRQREILNATKKKK